MNRGTLVYSATGAALAMSCCTLKEQQKQLYARYDCFYVNRDKSDMVDEVSCWKIPLYSSVTKFPLSLQMERNLNNVLKSGLFLKALFIQKNLLL